MVTRTVRAVAWMLVAAAAVFALSGCNNPTIAMKLANEGAYPITELLVYPSLAAGEDPGSEPQINRMPKDASGSTVALLPGDAAMLDWKFRNVVYNVSVTFYDSKNHEFRTAVAPNPLDLTGVKRGSLIILTAAMDTNNAATITYEVHEESVDMPSWLGGGLILAGAALVAFLLLWPFSIDL